MYGVRELDSLHGNTIEETPAPRGTVDTAAVIAADYEQAKKQVERKEKVASSLSNFLKSFSFSKTGDEVSYSFGKNGSSGKTTVQVAPNTSDTGGPAGLIVPLVLAGAGVYVLAKVLK